MTSIIRDIMDAEEVYNTITNTNGKLYDSNGKISEYGYRVLKLIQGKEIDTVIHGKWIEDKLNHQWFCSQCCYNPTKGYGYVQNSNELYKFCPYCGAKMDKELII